MLDAQADSHLVMEDWSGTEIVFDMVDASA